MNLPAATPVEIPGALSAFTVELGPVRSKSNFRRSSGKDRRAWAALRDYEDGVAALLRAVRPAGWNVGDPSVPVAQRPVVVAAVFARTTLDAGNLSKSILDAAQGVLYVTDSSVRGDAQLSERTRRDQGSVVGFAQLPAGASRGEIAAALAALVVIVVSG